MPYNNNDHINIVKNPLVYSPYSQPINPGRNVHPSITGFITAEDSSPIITEGGDNLITET